MKNKMSLGKGVMLFSLMGIALVFSVSSQVKAPTKVNKPVLTDSTAVISFKDINNFNAYLKQAASFEQYTKLSPEVVLTELWQWKIRNLSADSTKKK